jgi:hypothetical protein
MCCGPCYADRMSTCGKQQWLAVGKCNERARLETGAIGAGVGGEGSKKISIVAGYARAGGEGLAVANFGL